MILNSRLLSQKCRQRERIMLGDGLLLPSNSSLKMIRRQLVYAMKPEGSFYIVHYLSVRSANSVKRY